MQERYIGSKIIDRGYEIRDEWNNKKYKSSQIVNCVEKAVVLANTENTQGTRDSALSHLFAMELRIKEKYDKIIKCIIFYFSWRRETGAFKKFKSLLKIPEGKDLRYLLEIELEKLGLNVEEDQSEGSDRKNRGGKVTEKSGKETKTEQVEQQPDAVSEEGLEESPDKEKNEKKDDQREKIGKENSIDKQNSEVKESRSEEQRAELKTDRAIREPESKSLENGEDFSREKKVEIKQEHLYEYKIENNGSEKEAEPSLNKKVENATYNGAIDIPPMESQTKSESTVENGSFIDEVMKDNMVKGEKNILSGDLMRAVKQDGVEPMQASDTVAVEKNSAGIKDAHLYDKMVLNAESKSLQNSSNVTAEKPKAEVDHKSDEVKVPINEVKVPINEVKVPINELKVPINELKIPIKVDEHISEENVFRREINDKFNEQMVNIHKAFMENALREELNLLDDGLDAKESIGKIKESNVEELRAPMVSGMKH